MNRERPDTERADSNDGTAHPEDDENGKHRSSGKSAFEDKSIDRTVEELDTDLDNGLDEQEARRRLEQYGENRLEEDRKNKILKFFSHFWGPIPWMIEAATILSAVARHWEDFFVILTMLLINGGVGFWQESKAEDAIEALKRKLSPDARLLRGGEQKTVEAAVLVPGDIILLRMGDLMPADCKIFGDDDISVDESSLTGESLPVSKEEGDIAYSGTSVKEGETRAVVTATGRHTRFARTVELVEQADDTTHFRRAVLRIGYFLIAATALLVVIIAGFEFWRIETGVQTQMEMAEVLLFVMVLTIAGIPHALPAVLTVTMTVGANRLARMKAIVSHLPAMEEMAGLSVLCADKTGTLTLNKLQLQDPVVMGAEDEHDLILAAALTCRPDAENPIDRAVLGGLESTEELDDYEIEEFRPFDPTRKRAEADVKAEDGSFTVAKGAPQKMIELAGLEGNERDKVAGKVEELGRNGYRALGVARRHNGKWRFLGILPLLDPPREDSARVIRDAHEHDIDVRMVTGDHVAIARQVAGQIGLDADIIGAEEFFPDDLEKVQDDDDFRKKVVGATGYAQVTPEHKFQIIRQFQRSGKIVGMTGDGVNDTPALKQADVGIAVDGATDAARAAAPLVLTEPGLGVITRAVEEARRIFERMISYSMFRITETMRVLLFISISILWFGVYPVTPIMIVLLAILNDIPIMTIAADNAPTARSPVRWDMPRVLTIASVLSITGLVSSFLLYWFIKTKLNLPVEEIQTLIFLKLLVAGHMTIYIARQKGWMWQKPYPSLLLLLTLEGTQVIGTLVAVYGILVHPVGWSLALGVWGYAVLWLVILDAVKVATYKLLARFRAGREQNA